MFESAFLKIDRAAKHVSDLNIIFCDQRPFSYILETNTKTGERATFAKKNEAIIADAAIIIGDAVYNMRSALDHAYWEIVSPHVPADWYRKIQFPFSSKRKGFKNTIKQRAANKISLKFVRALYRLRPYHGAGGNELLCLIDKICSVDKHRLLTPTGDYTEITGEMLKRAVPDAPIHPDLTLYFGQNNRDIAWKTTPPTRKFRRANRLPEKIEEEIDIPVQIVFSTSEDLTVRPVIPTLYNMIEVTRSTVEILRNSI